MKAAVYRRYGPPEVVQLEEVDKPVPGDHELLVRVHATTVAAGDGRMRKPDPFAARLYNGLFRPRRITVLGFELAGEVEAIGKEVRRFRPGDQVFAFTGFGFGAHAQYCRLRESGKATRVGLVAHKPANMTFEQAAALPVGGLTAQAFVRKAGIRAGQRVLVYGASGSVGTYAVQLARKLSAEVTGVCSSSNVELVKSLGADEVIDYTRDDPAAGAGLYDLVFDAVGKTSASRWKSALKKGGRFISVMGSASLQDDDLESLRRLVEAGAVKPVIDRQYPLEQIAEAHRYVDQGRKRGNVIVTVSHDSPL